MTLRKANAWGVARANRIAAEKAAEAKNNSPDEIAAKQAANQRLAQRFTAPLSAEQTRLTLERYPVLAQSLDGEYSGNLDLRKIEIVTPQTVDRFAGPAVEQRLHDARIEKQRAELEQSGGYLSALGRK